MLVTTFSWEVRYGGGLSQPNLVFKVLAQIGHFALTPRLGPPNAGAQRVSGAAQHFGEVGGWPDTPLRKSCLFS